MLWTLAAVLGAAPSPSPSPGFDADAVTPGPWGFAVMAAIGVVVILLILDMVRRLRRVNYRAQIRERLEAEEAAKASGTTGDAAGGDDPRG
ncbi:hypothetical protein GCM10009840_29370 [Pseudolysinimonas kribbensis]|uniref:Uncharacterized protein n=1 Tax=Pseudolysinimonas kribbensis TaxID=433641 RepID=A0ABQ6KBD7_9MICO|nr:hypothetical protein [Pseudolysinimonas kribbensis]GMA96229.1 hypothetical protein GCM10025881_30530 [Pseudolysinimonas kribbensis]